MSTARFFIISGKGFARFSAFEGKDYGVLHVRSFSEVQWVEAGLIEIGRIEADVAAGSYVEFSPAALLAGVPSPARVAAARANGSKGGRPRKAV